MSETVITEVRRAQDTAAIVDIKGDVTSASEDELTDAYNRACEGETRVIIFNFTALDYMNSGGIGLIVTLLVRANRQHQRLLAFGLSEHYRQIFELTRLDEAISIYDGEVEALAAAGAPEGRSKR